MVTMQKPGPPDRYMTRKFWAGVVVLAIAIVMILLRLVK